MLSKVRDFLSRLFPPQIAAYIPGSKLVAGVILAALAGLGVGGTESVELPVIGDVDVTTLALGVGFYLFPQKQEPAD